MSKFNISWRYMILFVWECFYRHDYPCLQTLYQMNQKMEEDNKNLLMQIQSLLNSNQELLSQILNSKEHFAEEEKSYLYVPHLGGLSGDILYFVSLYFAIGNNDLFEMG